MVTDMFRLQQHSSTPWAAPSAGADGRTEGFSVFGSAGPTSAPGHTASSSPPRAQFPAGFAGIRIESSSASGSASAPEPAQHTASSSSPVLGTEQAIRQQVHQHQQQHGSQREAHPRPLPPPSREPSSSQLSPQWQHQHMGGASASSFDAEGPCFTAGPSSMSNSRSGRHAHLNAYALTFMHDCAFNATYCFCSFWRVAEVATG